MCYNLDLVKINRNILYQLKHKVTIVRKKNQKYANLVKIFKDIYNSRCFPRLRPRIYQLWRYMVEAYVLF